MPAVNEVNIYAIYPDYWKETWGEKPLLGFVKAFNEFEASRRAYTAGLLRQNFTFEPQPVLMDRKKMRDAVKKEKDRARRR